MGGGHAGGGGGGHGGGGEVVGGVSARARHRVAEAGQPRVGRVVRSLRRGPGLLYTNIIEYLCEFVRHVQI